MNNLHVNSGCKELPCYWIASASNVPLNVAGISWTQMKFKWNSGSFESTHRSCTSNVFMKKLQNFPMRNNQIWSDPKYYPIRLSFYHVLCEIYSNKISLKSRILLLVTSKIQFRYEIFNEIFFNEKKNILTKNLFDGSTMKLFKIEKSCLSIPFQFKLQSVGQIIVQVFFNMDVIDLSTRIYFNP